VSASRVALVTGAGRRVGQAIAVALAAPGTHVVVHYHGTADGAHETAARIVQAGGTASLLPADLRDPHTAPRVIADAVEQGGRLDVLVNSAASMLRTPLETVTPEQWDEVFALNLRSPFFLAVHAARAMAERGGVIVNISDHMAFESWPAFIPHGIAKGGVAVMARQLAGALAPTVRVNAVVPGAVLAPEGWSAEAQAAFLAATPLARLGTPDDVAHAVRYLVEAPYVTGETLFVDGGRTGAR
jgi:pteridine reductase